jgi:hypothetical protein
MLPFLRTLRPAFGLRLLVVAASGATFAGAAEKSAPLPKESPFRAAGAPAENTAPGETLEFAGVSSMGKTTHLIFHDKTTKKNRWVGIGETVDEISVLNYDARLEQAVVRVNGVQKILPLRKGTGPANAPHAATPVAANFAAPAPLPAPSIPHTVSPNTTPATVQPAAPLPAPAPPPAGPATPETIAKQEQEARMLVSDLLEIGMAQRKAYEEQQRRAAEQGAQPAAPAPTAGK